MKNCERCVKAIEASKGYPSSEQLEELGNSESKPWCEICKQLMVANYRIRQECDKPRNLFDSGHFNPKNTDASFTRFDV